MNNKDMPAYAVTGKDGPVRATQDGPPCIGVTKLEAFTMAALQGLCANTHEFMMGKGSQGIALTAIEVAEAALAELEKRND